jgi:hypothetical protein
MQIKQDAIESAFRDLLQNHVADTPISRIVHRSAGPGLCSHWQHNFRVVPSRDFEIPCECATRALISGNRLVAR